MKVQSTYNQDSFSYNDKADLVAIKYIEENI